MFPILIVDDSRDDLMLAERVFRSHRFLNPIRLINSGDECIKYFRNFGGKDDPHADPCLLFLDLTMMPTSGLEVLRAIQGTPVARKSIIIMLSAVTDLKLLREGYQNGGRTFLLKPLTAEGLVEFLAAIKDKIRMDHIDGGYALRWVSTPTSMTTRVKLGV